MDSKWESLSLEDRVLIYCLAVLRARHRLTQSEAADKLGIPHAKANMVEHVAKENRVLVLELYDDLLPVDPTERAEFDELVECKLCPVESTTGAVKQPLTEILHTVNSSIRSVQVFPTRFHRKDTTEEWQKRIDAFSACCCPYVASLLATAQVVGVSWGTTVWRAVEKILLQQAWIRRSEGVVCLPTTAEMVGIVQDTTPGTSPSLLANLLARAVKNNHSPALSLLGVPAFIPLMFKGTKLETIWELIRSHDNYQAVFEWSGPTGTLADDPPKAAIDQLDAIVTSVGGFDQTQKLWTKELDAGGLSKADLEEIVVGDIGGVLLEKENLEPKGESLLNDILSHMTGITKEQYLQCAKKEPGIIVLAIGHNKAKVVLECIRRGLVNHLFIDADLAGELAKLLGFTKVQS